MTKMIRWCALIGLVVLTVGLAACAKDDAPTAPTPAPAPAPAPPPPPAPTVAALTGTVSNIAGQRVAAARVTILDGPDRGLSIETNANGEFRFGSLSISNANFSATGGGYLEVRLGTHVDGTNTLNFVFTRASLTGTVSNTDGARIAGATVRILDGPNAGQSVMSDGGGAFRFDSLNVANANLSANADGHDEDRRGTFVNGTNTVNFSLVAHPPEEAPPGEGEPVAAELTITAKIAVGGPGGATQEWEVEAVSNIPFISDSYQWEFGDGNGAGDTGRVERHVYRKGNYTVKVRATRADGNGTMTAELEIRVE